MIEKNKDDVTFLNEDIEMKKIMSEYFNEQIYTYGNMDLLTREILVLVVLTVTQGNHMIEDCVRSLYKNGMKLETIKEVVYQVIPYVGLSRVNETLIYINEAFKKSGVKVNQHTETIESNDDRFTKGMNIQCLLFSKEVIENNHRNAPDDLKHIQMALTTHCFGDFYTRKGLSLNQRGLITFCAIASLGGCENQLRAHANANMLIGNTRQILIEAITQCQPYIGFPRTLNAIAVIEEVCNKAE